MKILITIGALLLGLVVLGSVVVGLTYVSYYNKAVQYETTLVGKLDDNKNVIAQYTIKISEMAQVPAMYKEDLKDVIKSTFEGRYGSDGSRGVMQWIQEQNLPFDSSLYTRIQQTMEAGRNQFTNVQTQLIDQRVAYEVDLNSVWSGFWMKLGGFPKVDLDDFKPVLGVGTEQMFENKIDTGVQLRNNHTVE